MVCNCCQTLIVGRNQRGAYRARLGVYAEVAPRTIYRVGWTDRAVCAPCTAQIHAAHEARIAQRNRAISRSVAYA